MSHPVRDRRGARREDGGVLRALWAGPASWALAGAVGVFHRLHDRGLLRRHRVDVPVISVGGLTVGGSGKTPFARWLAAELLVAGRRPAILSRGYRGRGRGVRVVSATEPDARRDGDEPALLARSLPDVPVIVAVDRRAGAQLARECGADVLLLDDGFQHRRLARNLDIVLWDRRSEASRGRLIPAGLLREARRGLGRAGLLVLIDRGDGPPTQPRCSLAPERVFAARLVGRPLSPLAPGIRLHALSGIADPGAFERSLVRQGYVVTGATRFADHHAFRPDEIREAVRLAGDQGAGHLAITAKDHSRWPDEEGLPVPAVFDVDVEVTAAEALLAVVERHCAGGAA